MRPVDEFVISYLSDLSALFFVRQCLVIIAIFLFGAILTDALMQKECRPLLRAVLAFPAGISAFIITAYVLIVAGIPYTAASLMTAVLLITAIAVFRSRDRFFSSGIRSYKKNMLTAVSFAVIISLIACSGLAPVSISNDTMYYFRRYPDAIVFYRGLRDQFDFFMTDTGLGSVVIDTLSALFGFGETFGIREFFHIDFTVFFAICIYDRAKKHMSQKAAVIAAVIVTALLVVSTPFFILGHWALANMYFMEMFFIAAYLVTADDRCAFEVDVLIMIALSLLRVEGTLFVIWLAACLAAFTGLGKKIAVYVLLPVAVLFGGYCTRLYTAYNVLDNQYTFLTPSKAVILTGLIGASAVFLYFVSDLLYARFGKRQAYLYLALMLAGNLLMLLRDPALYTGNLSAFYANLFRQSGWGLFPYFVIAAVLLLVAQHILNRVIKHTKKSAPAMGANLYNITMVAGFILIVLAASYGRGDVLAEDVGDSGNRVLLQIAPLVVMMLAELFMTEFSDEA